MPSNNHDGERPKPNKPNHPSPRGSRIQKGGTKGNQEKEPPSCWIDEHPDCPPSQSANSASFVEYLRWMRVKSGKGTIDGGTLLELLSKFENNDFSKSLTRLTDRTKKLAHQWFEASCPWRIRVGGAKGPESMLLPAFDALGMPYIPSSTLKGVARSIASQDPSVTERELKEIFGDISPDFSIGQVIFLDAYPLPGENKQGGLMPDMANSIWKWDGTEPPTYNTNPNVFLSLKDPTFVIGLRRGIGCSDDTFNRVQKWLKKGLGHGIGSRVNTGYGALHVKGETKLKKKRILLVKFQLKGQLIHGGQTFQEWRLKEGGGWKPPGIADPEVRSVAFRSMLRYWFRALALGVLQNEEVRDLEMEIFGGIEPGPHTGLFRLEVQGEVKRDNAPEGNEGEYGLATGTLTLRNSSQTSGLEENKKSSLEGILKNLTWLMFHLGGVGQGSRRPCYSRQDRPKPPWWRGATLTPVSKDEFWRVPNDVTQLTQAFRQRLTAFYTELGNFRGGGNIDFSNPRPVVDPTKESWAETVDSNCRIVCVTGNPQNSKPFALAVLHEVGRLRNGYDQFLCGSTNTPSPVWVAKVGKCQVVTAFGITEDSSGPRYNYLQKLEQMAGPKAYRQIWPFT